MASLRLETNDDGKVSGFHLDDVEAMTSSDGSVVFYADNIRIQNGYDIDKVSVSDIDVNKMKKLVK